MVGVYSSIKVWDLIYAEFNVSQIEVLHQNLEPTGIRDYLDSIKPTITGPDQIQLFWSAGQVIGLRDFIIEAFNEFAESIPNPVVFWIGLLGPIDHTQLKFIVSNSMYFEYEANNFWKTRPMADPVDIDYSVRKTHKFLNMGTKDYPQRKFILSHIVNNGLLDQGYVSYAQLGSGQMPLIYTPEQVEHITSVGNTINHLLPMPSLDNSNEWTVMPTHFMTDSYLNMITDTYYETPDGYTFLSEKVFNAIHHGQMFIMLSPPGTLAYLRSHGYQTFSDFIDESYDDITNHYDRILAVTRSFMSFVQRPIEEIHEIYQKCIPILEHNRQRLTKASFLNDLFADVQKAISLKTIHK
jgi:hypothetical protein